MMLTDTSQNAFKGCNVHARPVGGGVTFKRNAAETQFIEEL